MKQQQNQNHTTRAKAQIANFKRALVILTLLDEIGEAADKVTALNNKAGAVQIELAPRHVARTDHAEDIAIEIREMLYLEAGPDDEARTILDDARFTFATRGGWVGITLS